MTQPTPNWLLLKLLAFLICACSDPTPRIANTAPGPIESLAKKGKQLETGTPLPGASPQSATPQRAKQALSVATFNINFGNVDLASISQTIADADVDFVFLQETNRVSAAFLTERLRDQYKHRSFIDSNRRWAAGGFGFLSKTPFEKPRFLPAKHGLFGTLLTKIKVDDRVVQLVNLHLSPIRVGSASSVVQMFAALTKMEEVHEKEVGPLSKYFDAALPTIIAGDFNSASTQKVPSLLRERGFIDAIDMTVENADQKKTWRWPVRGHEVGFRIDYVFCSPHFAPTQGAIVESTASDHHLVRTDLDWTQRAAPSKANGLAPRKS